MPCLIIHSCSPSCPHFLPHPSILLSFPHVLPHPSLLLSIPHFFTNPPHAYLWGCVLSNILWNPSWNWANSSAMAAKLGSAGRVRKSAHDRLESQPVVGLGNFFRVCVPPAMSCRHSSYTEYNTTYSHWLTKNLIYNHIEGENVLGTSLNYPVVPYGS